MENSCDPLLHGEGKVAVAIRAERNRSFSAPKGTGAAVSLTRARNYSPAFQRCGNSGCMVGYYPSLNGLRTSSQEPRKTIPESRLDAGARTLTSRGNDIRQVRNKIHARKDFHPRPTICRLAGSPALAGESSIALGTAGSCRITPHGSWQSVYHRQ